MEDFEDMSDDIDQVDKDPSIVKAEKKQKVAAVQLKFERYREMKEETKKYDEEEKKMQVEVIDNKEEMDSLEKELTIEFGKEEKDDGLDQDKVSTVLERGKDELYKKMEEFKGKKERLEKEIKDLEVVEWEIQKKESQHLEMACKVNNRRIEIEKKQKDIYDRRKELEIQKEKFADDYVEAKQEKERFEKMSTKLKIQKA